MTIINSAADVRAAFPGAEIDQHGLCFRGAVFLSAVAYKQSSFIDGDLTDTQIVALAYWITHRDEFKTS